MWRDVEVILTFCMFAETPGVMKAHICFTYVLMDRTIRTTSKLRENIPEPPTTSPPRKRLSRELTEY